jgi:hypothetical protein
MAVPIDVFGPSAYFPFRYYAASDLPAHQDDNSDNSYVVDPAPAEQRAKCAPAIRDTDPDFPIHPQDAPYILKHTARIECVLENIRQYDDVKGIVGLKIVESDGMDGKATHTSLLSRDTVQFEALSIEAHRTVTFQATPFVASDVQQAGGGRRTIKSAGMERHIAIDREPNPI